MVRYGGGQVRSAIFIRTYVFNFVPEDVCGKFILVTVELSITVIIIELLVDSNVN